jgi:hypothetical protein
MLPGQSSDASLPCSGDYNRPFASIGIAGKPAVRHNIVVENELADALHGS